MGVTLIGVVVAGALWGGESPLSDQSISYMLTRMWAISQLCAMLLLLFQLPGREYLVHKTTGTLATRSYSSSTVMHVTQVAGVFISDTIHQILITHTSTSLLRTIESIQL